MAEKTPEQAWFSRAYENFEQSLNGQKKSSFHATRTRAFEALQNKGLPTAREESWKYTNTAPIERFPFKIADEAQPYSVLDRLVEESRVANLESHLMVFLNGEFRPESSQLTVEAQGVHVDSIAACLEGKSPLSALFQQHIAQYASIDNGGFAALNTAFLHDGLVIHLEKGASLERPIEILFLSTGEEGLVSYPRVLIVAEEGSAATVIESYTGDIDGKYFTSSVTEISVAKNATVDHYRIQTEGTAAYHISSLEARQETGSIFRTHSFSFGGSLVRNEVNPLLNGEDIKTTMNGLSVLGESQHVDNTTVIDHAKPNCESFEHYKGIYGDSSKGIFSGTIIVRPDAQKTNAFQSNQSLLLDDKASSHSKPQLKIWADDVKCSHGATIGQLDSDALFYLRSRGISLSKARQLLIHAFASEIISQVTSEALVDHLESLLMNKLQEIADISEQ